MQRWSCRNVSGGLLPRIWARQLTNLTSVGAFLLSVLSNAEYFLDFYKIQGFYWLAVRVAAAQGGLCTVKLLNVVKWCSVICVLAFQTTSFSLECCSLLSLCISTPEHAKCTHEAWLTVQVTGNVGLCEQNMWPVFFDTLSCGDYFMYHQV